MKLASSTVAAALVREWGLRVAAVDAHDTGMNSRTWHVTADDGRWVAKAVPSAERARLASGLAVGALVEAGGIPTGAARRTPDGRLLVDIDGHALALLRYLDGAPLTDHPRDQPRIGSTLAGVHRALAGRTVAGAERFHWLEPDRPHTALRDWIRPAITGALGAWQRLEPQTLTWGLLHSDPAPEAVLMDSNGVCGLIDWDRGLVGPLLYDLASAVLYIGGPARATRLIAAYLAGGTLDPSEVDRGLLPVLRLRWAAQADYFASRIAHGDLTGIETADENEKGLEDARLALADEGFVSTG